MFSTNSQMIFDGAFPDPSLSQMPKPPAAPKPASYFNTPNRTTVEQQILNQGAPERIAYRESLKNTINSPSLADLMKWLVPPSGGGGGGGGMSGPSTSSYQNALDSARNPTYGRESFVNQDLLNQIRGAEDIAASQAAYQQMMQRLISSIAESESAGSALLGNLRGGATEQLQNIMGAMEEQRSRSAGQVSDIYSRAGADIRNLENVYGGQLSGIGEQIARGAAAFGVEGAAPEGLGALSAIAQQANIRQGAAMDSAMASRANVASGLQYDRSQEIQREYDSRMAELAQAARSARTQAELQQIQAEAEFERQKAQRALAAAQEESAMNQRYMDYLLGLEREQRGILTDAGSRGVSLV
jgi:hypothetical protein